MKKPESKPLKMIVNESYATLTKMLFQFFLPQPQIIFTNTKSQNFLPTHSTSVRSLVSRLERFACKPQN